MFRYLRVKVLLLAALLALTSAARAGSFDWTKHGVVTAVRSQGDSRNCWAIAATEALESSWAIHNGVNVRLSPQPILDRLKLSGSSTVEAALTDLAKKGTTTEVRYRYTHVVGSYRNVAMPYKPARWGRVPGDKVTVAQLKSALRRHGPMALWVDSSNPAFSRYRSGVCRMPRPPKGDHFVLLVGWSDRHRAWKVKNSWGTGWGLKGYMWIGYDSVPNATGCAAWVDAQTRKSRATLSQGQGVGRSTSAVRRAVATSRRPASTSGVTRTVQRQAPRGQAGHRSADKAR